MASVSKAPLVWIDCEMTGLNTDIDTIMSLAVFVTDADLNFLDETGYEAIIHHDKEQLDRMGEWCTRHHGQSGLTQACLDSTTTAEEAAEGLLSYIKKYVPERRIGLLAGNSVHADKSFLVKEPYKIVVDHLNYRIMDVSSIKEAARRWAPKATLNKIPRKQMLHEARADILESIEEARYYRKTFFVTPPSIAEAQK
ncbi:Orn Oligoribonuclease 3'-_5' exoribonuclease [Pyrenophora tritici-repentis]|uniref:Oligoribonuclease n=2 Tax=Pyrenophora tritici-repentis TaxID=45151 RepID=A0A2W1GYU6_9PLEO|nr:oligoribonuclease [Pyrenophora tritici-repentis Pt-1C-BFP]KAA8615357.1 Oligoribonuclease [Pyrenophora tritici-repentis]EDU51605.1 oligoribonuclease [Pyrenophora tritici-repentis Pt-1C-BFP]KAF7444057.1 Oligoribonuclease [Pyrenophora tritici-repentis]KAF7566204.1 Orn, Oligoribonuclease (3'-to-5' exoribonuclease) [Pyrenophora tritici-repentis]KAG9379799.1 Oligoribonuclease [Pyrenophora tritici-repentis]